MNDLYTWYAASICNYGDVSGILPEGGYLYILIRFPTGTDFKCACRCFICMEKKHSDKYYCRNCMLYDTYADNFLDKKLFFVDFLFFCPIIDM